MIYDPMVIACGAGVPLAIANAYVDGTLDPDVHTLEYGLIEGWVVEQRAAQQEQPA